MKRPILQEPDERLTQRCEPFRFGNADDTRLLLRLILDMRDSMGPTDLGLAAPQIGCMVRVIVATLSGIRTPMVNPTLIFSGPMRPSLEKCLSVATSQRVIRYTRVSATWQDADGKLQSGIFKNQDAVVLQHECDHLDGITISGSINRKSA